MSYPGEEAAWHTIHSPFADATSKAEARIKLAQIEETKRKNAEGLARYRVRQGYCPTCGRGPE